MSTHCRALNCRLQFSCRARPELVNGLEQFIRWTQRDEAPAFFVLPCNGLAIRIQRPTDRYNRIDKSATSATYGIPQSLNAARVLDEKLGEGARTAIVASQCNKRYYVATPRSRPLPYVDRRGIYANNYASTYKSFLRQSAGRDKNFAGRCDALLMRA